MSLILFVKGKRAKLGGVAVWPSKQVVTRKFVVCKGKCESEQWSCPSMADVHRQTESRNVALSVGRDDSSRNRRMHSCARRYTELLRQQNRRSWVKWQHSDLHLGDVHREYRSGTMLRFFTPSPLSNYFNNCTVNFFIIL